jgi:hypothetical protein
MTLQASGSISLAQIRDEFRGTGQVNISTYVNKVGKSAAANQNVAFSNFYGKSNAYVLALTIVGNTTNYDLRAAAIAAGWDGTTIINLTCTINTGVYVYATSTGVYAFSTGTSYPAGSTISIINNGTIVGMGGNGGGGGGAAAAGAAGSAGGPAFYAGVGCTVTNNGNISGGGGGGGGGAGA